jgi:hypothetical protein
MPHHDSVPSRRLNQRISPSATADFFNKIGQKATSPIHQALVISTPDSVAKVLLRHGT